jgi:hypothetical protein
MNKILGTFAVLAVAGIFLVIAGCGVILEQRR